LEDKTAGLPKDIVLGALGFFIGPIVNNKKAGNSREKP
jgi:hypothetical protein